MSPIMESIFHHEEPTDLPDHGLPVRERDVEAETKVCDDGVEEVDLGEFDGEVLEEDVFCAGPLFGSCGNLGLNRR